MLIASRYCVESEISRGGFGIVYRARDMQLHERAVVVKVGDRMIDHGRCAGFMMSQRRSPVLITQE